MSEFTIRTKVLAVSGHQFWTVEAETAAEALKKFEEGEAHFEQDDIEVIDIGKPEIEEA